MFIEIPLILNDNETHDLDYEELGIKPPEYDCIIATCLLNLDAIERINHIPTDKDGSNTNLFLFDNTVYRTPLTYEQVKDLILK